MPEEIAISVQNINKVYKLYDYPQDRLKESLHPLRKKYHHDYYALSDVSFEVKRGETVGIIGRNGSGKSTLLKIITGILTPTSGSVNVNGRISALLELGAGFNPDLTGIENIYFNGTLMGYSKEEMDAKLDNILSFADIGEFVYQPVKAYSSGMFVRLAFAVAINADPYLLIVDEALAVGDARFQLKCFKQLSLFQEQGKTILFVSHDLGSVKRMCSHAILLEQGQVILQGVPNDAVNIYSKLIAENGGIESVKDDIAILKQGINTRTTEVMVPSRLNLPNPTLFDERTRMLRLDEKSHQQISGKEYAYGGEFGVIDSIVITDEQDFPKTVFTTGDLAKVHFTAHALDDIYEPIYAMTIKDARGQEIYGINTLAVKQQPPDVIKGKTVKLTFTQKLNIMPGEYFISLGWTRFIGTDLSVIQRRYDVIKFDVMSDDGTFGIANCYSKIIIENVET